VIVYLDRLDPVLVVDAQRAGAFVEVRRRLAAALPAYVNATLPPRDRRNLLSPDRRAKFRGGRRLTDRASVWEGDRRARRSGRNT
jgi:hypothetical protein